MVDFDREHRAGANRHVNLEPTDRAAACGNLKLLTSCLPLLSWYLDRSSIAESDSDGAVDSYDPDRSAIALVEAWPANTRLTVFVIKFGVLLVSI
jgi:hypothetical protein